MKTSELIAQLQEIEKSVPFDAEVVIGDDWISHKLIRVVHNPPHTFLVFDTPEEGE